MYLGESSVRMISIIHISTRHITCNECVISVSLFVIGSIRTFLFVHRVVHMIRTKENYVVPISQTKEINNE